jgi:hypothetical protein
MSADSEHFGQNDGEDRYGQTGSTDLPFVSAQEDEAEEERLQSQGPTESTCRP